MPYAISKLVWFLTQPSSLILIALLGGLLLATKTRFTYAGRRLAWFGIVGLLVGGLSPLANIAMLPLEERFPVPPLKSGNRAFTGIIVLGGAESGDVSVARGQLTLNEAAERVTEGARLAHLLPTARLIFTGGAAQFIFEGVPGADAVGGFWRSIGISGNRIALESKSLTTWDNAVLTHQLLKPTAGQRFLLVTSAHHMPRAMGAFRRAGLDVVAYPVDFRTVGTAHALRFFDSVPSGLRRLDEAAREWAGLVAYRVSDRSAALFPAP
jgi:uncharacterized SAM-binding protein YcdF (DUF218 family)